MNIIPSNIQVTVFLSTFWGQVIVTVVDFSGAVSMSEVTQSPLTCGR